MAGAYMSTYISLVVLCTLQGFVKLSQLNQCKNLKPYNAKILELSSSLRVWLGSEVSITCCMRENQREGNENYFEDDFESSSSKETNNIFWYGPDKKPVVNYFLNNSLAEKIGVYFIPELIQKEADIQVAHLIIKNFSRSDSGEYQCDTMNSQHVPANITIEGVPKVIIDAEEYQFLEEGSSGEIFCKPRGYPKIGVVWFYEGNHLQPGDPKYSFLKNHQVLRISQVVEDIAGKYLCKAEVSLPDRINSKNYESFLEIKPIQVVVYQIPTISDDSPIIKSNAVDGMDVAAVEGGSLQLACDSKGLPPPVISWYRNGELLNSTLDDRVQISESYYRRNVYSSIRIQPVQVKDIGQYTCNSSITFKGFSVFAAKNITPELAFQPRFLNLIDSSNVSSLMDKNVTLICSVFGAYLSRLSVSFVQERYDKTVQFLNESTRNQKYKFETFMDNNNPYISHLQLKILDIDASDAGWYYCRAFLKNSDAYSVSPIIVVSVFSPPIIRTKKSVKYGLWYKKNFLRCEAKGYPNPKWEWRFRNLPLNDRFNQYSVTVTNKNDTSISELVIFPNYLNDAVFGTYTCMAANEFGTDNFSISFNQATQPGAPGVRVCKVTPSSIQLCVTANSETGGLPLTHYELRVKGENENRFHGPYYYPVSPSRVTLSYLKSNMLYKIALCAASEAGRSPNTYVEIKTRPLGIPIIELVNTSAAPTVNAFNLAWKVDSDGGLPIVQYDVEIQEVKVDSNGGRVVERIGSPKHLVINDMDQLKRMVRVNSLNQSTWYELKFQAKNLLGPSMIQEVIFKTLEAPSFGKSARLRDPLGTASTKSCHTLLLALTFVLVSTQRYFIHT